MNGELREGGQKIRRFTATVGAAGHDEVWLVPEDTSDQTAHHPAWTDLDEDAAARIVHATDLSHKMNWAHHVIGQEVLNFIRSFGYGVAVVLDHDIPGYGDFDGIDSRRAYALQRRPDYEMHMPPGFDEQQYPHLRYLIVLLTP